MFHVVLRHPVHYRQCGITERRRMSMQGVKFDPLENRNPFILLSSNLAQLIRSVGRTHVPNLVRIFSEVLWTNVLNILTFIDVFIYLFCI